MNGIEISYIVQYESFVRQTATPCTNPQGYLKLLKTIASQLEGPRNGSLWRGSSPRAERTRDLAICHTGKKGGCRMHP